MTRGGKNKKKKNTAPGEEESECEMGPESGPPWMGPGPPPPGGWGPGGPQPGSWGPDGPPPQWGCGPDGPPGGWGPGGPGGFGPRGPPGGFGPRGPPGNWGPGGPQGDWGPRGPPGGWGPRGPPGGWGPGGPQHHGGWGPDGPPPGGWGPGGHPPHGWGHGDWGPDGPPPHGDWGPGGPPPPGGWGPGGPPPPGGWGPGGPPAPGSWGPGGPPPPGGCGPSPGSWGPGGPEVWPGGPQPGYCGVPDPNYLADPMAVNPMMPPLGYGPITVPPPDIAPVVPGYNSVPLYPPPVDSNGYITVPPPTWQSEAVPYVQEPIVNPAPEQPAWIKALISGPETIIPEKIPVPEAKPKPAPKVSKQPKDDAPKPASPKKTKPLGLLGTRTFDKPLPGRSTGIISLIGPSYGFIEREDLKKFTFSFDAFFGNPKAMAPGVRVHFTAMRELQKDIATDVKVAPGGTENVDTEIYEGVVMEPFREGQIGVRQKAGKLEANIGPDTIRLPYEKRDCRLTLLKGDHVLINLLTDMVSQNRRATNIKPKVPATFKYTGEKREEGTISNIKDTEGTIASDDHPELAFDLTENLSDTEFSLEDDVEFTVISVKDTKKETKRAIRVRKLKPVIVKSDPEVLEEAQKEAEEEKEEDQPLSFKKDTVSADEDNVSAKEDTVSAQEDAVVAKEDTVVTKEDAAVSKEVAAVAKEDTVVAKKTTVVAKKTTVVIKEEPVEEQVSSAPVVDVYYDPEREMSFERYEGTILKAIQRISEKPPVEGQTPEMGQLVMTVDGEQKHLAFTRGNIRSNATMLDGDRVKFNISTHKETKEEQATRLDILRCTFEESTEQRRSGIVIEIEETTGLIKCQQNPQLFFKMSEVMETKKLQLNQKVEFSVVPHGTAEGGTQAIRIVRMMESAYFFTPVGKMANIVKANQEKKKMTIKLMKDPIASVTDKDELDENKPKDSETFRKKAVVNKPNTGRKDAVGGRRRYGRSRSSSGSPVRDKFGRYPPRKRSPSPVRGKRSPSPVRGKRSPSPVRERYKKARRSRSGSRERSRRPSRSRSRSRSMSKERSHHGSRDRTGPKVHHSREREGNGQRRSRETSLPPGGSRHGGVVDKELARKKRELEDLNDMIAYRQAMVAMEMEPRGRMMDMEMEPRGRMMDMRPMEKTCIDYDHGRIAVPITEYRPMRSILKKPNEDFSGPMYPIKTEPPDHDQYHYNPPTLDHIQSYDSPEYSHPSYDRPRSSYYDPYETTEQHSSYHSQSSQNRQAPIHTQSAYQPSPSQPLARETPPRQLSPRETPPKQPPHSQTPPSSKPPSPPSQPEEKRDPTPIDRFLSLLNKGTSSTRGKEARDKIVEKTQDLSQRYSPRTADDEYRDHHRSKEAEPEGRREKAPDEHSSPKTTDLVQDDLLPHERAIQDGSGFSRIVGNIVPADEGERHKRSSGSAERHKRDRDGRKLTPTKETKEGGSKSKSEHFDKIQTLLRTIGLNLNTADVTKLADRTQDRLSKKEKLSSEHLDKEQGHSSSRTEDPHRSLTGSHDSEHPRSSSPVRSSSQEPYSGRQQTFLDREEEQASKKVRLMQSLTKTTRNTPDQSVPITTPATTLPSPSSSSPYPQELPGTSQASTPYGWHQGASTQYPVTASSNAATVRPQAPVMYPPPGFSAYAAGPPKPPLGPPPGPPPGLPPHFFRQHPPVGPPPIGPPPVGPPPFGPPPIGHPPVGPPPIGQPPVGPPPVCPPPVSTYGLNPLVGSPVAQSTSLANSPDQVNILTQVTLPANDSLNQITTTTTISRCLKVVETVRTVQKSVKSVQFNLEPAKATTESNQTSSGAEDDIKERQKQRLEQFNQRMMEKSKQNMKDSWAARNKPPEKLIKTEPKNIWICGHSLIYWAETRAKSPEVGMQLGLDPSSGVVWWKGTQGMMWSQLVPQLLQLKIKWPNPDVLIMHLGGNDLGTDSPTDLLASLKEDLTSMRSIFPNCLLVWSDILPRRVWRHSDDSLEVDLVRATINRRVHSIIGELGGTALTHSNIRCGTDTGLYRPDGVHLSGKGIDMFNLNLQDFLEKWESDPSPEES